MASLRVSSVFVVKFGEAMQRMNRRGAIPYKLAIEEFLDEMKVDLLDALVGEPMSRFLLKTLTKEDLYGHSLLDKPAS